MPGSPKVAAIHLGKVLCPSDNSTVRVLLIICVLIAVVLWSGQEFSSPLVSAGAPTAKAFQSTDLIGAVARTDCTLEDDATEDLRSARFDWPMLLSCADAGLHKAAAHPGQPFLSRFQTLESQHVLLRV